MLFLNGQSFSINGSVYPSVRLNVHQSVAVCPTIHLYVLLSVRPNARHRKLLFFFMVNLTIALIKKIIKNTNFDKEIIKNTKKSKYKQVANWLQTGRKLAPKLTFFSFTWNPTVLHVEKLSKTVGIHVLTNTCIYLVKHTTRVVKLTCFSRDFYAGQSVSIFLKNI